jgi:hypothetical protein
MIKKIILLLCLFLVACSSDYTITTIDECKTGDKLTCSSFANQDDAPKGFSICINNTWDTSECISIESDYCNEELGSCKPGEIVDCGYFRWWKHGTGRVPCTKCGNWDNPQDYCFSKTKKIMLWNVVFNHIPNAGYTDITQIRFVEKWKNEGYVAAIRNQCGTIDKCTDSKWKQLSWDSQWIDVPREVSKKTFIIECAENNFICYGQKTDVFKDGVLNYTNYQGIELNPEENGLLQQQSCVPCENKSIFLDLTQPLPLIK